MDNRQYLLQLENTLVDLNNRSNAEVQGAASSDVLEPLEKKRTAFRDLIKELLEAHPELKQPDPAQKRDQPSAGKAFGGCVQISIQQHWEEEAPMASKHPGIGCTCHGCLRMVSSIRQEPSSYFWLKPVLHERCY